MSPAPGGSRLPIFAAFEESGDYSLLPEFVETLVADEDVPRLLRRRIWALASTPAAKLPIVSMAVVDQYLSEHEQVCADIVAAFQDSDCASDLAGRWQKIVDARWPSFPDCLLKSELSPRDRVSRDDRDPRFVVARDEVYAAPALTVGQTIEMLSQFDPSAKFVLSSPTYGDFDLVGDNGSDLSEDNFEHDFRPILKIRARHREGGRI